MDSKDLQTLIKGYNSQEDGIFDKCTDLFILKVRNELERMYKNDEWGKMTQVSDLGIYISKMCHDFKNFEFKILPFASGRNGKTISDVYGYMTFSYYIKYEEYKGSELCTFEDDDILAMKPFCEFLERKGFGCYVDLDKQGIIDLCRKNDKEKDWSYGISDEDLDAHAEKCAETNENLKVECPKYGIEYIDTHIDREEILNKIMKKIEKEMR